jgi:ribulose-phosphate 3-epimerase
MAIVIPSILSDSLDAVQSQLNRIQLESNLNRVQIDIVDPDFADEVTISPIDLLQLDLHAFVIDIHLMTNDPINDVIECTQIPGISTIIAQIEHMSSQKDFCEHVHSFGLRWGLSLDLSTTIEALDSDVLPTLSSIQVMGINAGAQGRPFAGEIVYEKIKSIRAINSGIELLVDGGIGPENAGELERLGASGLVIGTDLWESDNLAGAIAKLGLSS